MKNICLTIAAAALLCVTPSMAQERTAGGSLQNEASWSALKSLVNKAQGDANLNKIDINAIKNCAASGKLYAGAGCRDAVIPADPNLGSVLTCGSQGKVFAPGVGCIETSGSTRWVHTGSGPSTGSTQFTSYNEIRRKLSDAGIPECGTTLLLGYKCSPAGSRCAMIDSSERSCGSQGDNTCHQYTTRVFTCN